jgi:hypothetical protein
MLAIRFSVSLRHSVVRNLIMPMLSALPRRRVPGIIACTLLFAATSGVSPHAAEHTLMPSPQTVHIGYFLATVKPVLSIDSGDVVTLESAADLVPSVVDQSGVVPPSVVPQYVRDIYGQVKDRGPGPHILTGPIEIRRDAGRRARGAYSRNQSRRRLRI